MPICLEFIAFDVRSTIFFIANPNSLPLKRSAGALVEGMAPPSRGRGALPFGRPISKER